MSYKKDDPIDDFVSWLFRAGFHVAWAIVAGTFSLIVRLLQTPPEYELDKRKRSSGWGEPGQMLECPHCDTVNDLNAPTCSMCGTEL